jgi:hypothetical protein
MATEGKSRRAEPTTGKRANSKKQTTRRHTAIALDSEQRARLVLLGGAAVVIIIAAVFLAFGYWYTQIKPEGRTVLEADGEKVTFAEMKRRMKYEYFSSVTFQQNLGVLPEATYLNMLNELTLIKRAESELGVTASQDEIDAKLRSQLGVAEDADQATFVAKYKAALDASGLKDGEYRQLVKSQVLEQKVRDLFESQAPATVPQAKLETITVADQALATATLDRLKAGEDFATVAKEVSAEPDVDTTGGVKEFAPQGGFNVSYDDFAFTGAVGELSGVISGPSQQFYIVRIIDRQDMTLTEDQKPDYVDRKFGDWLTETQAKMTVVRHWDVDDQREALLDTKLQQRQQQPQQPLPTVLVSTPVADATAPAQSPGDSAPQSAPQPNP